MFDKIKIILRIILLIIPSHVYGATTDSYSNTEDQKILVDKVYVVNTSNNKFVKWNFLLEGALGHNMMDIDRIYIGIMGHGGLLVDYNISPLLGLSLGSGLQYDSDINIYLKLGFRYFFTDISDKICLGKNWFCRVYYMPYMNTITTAYDKVPLFIFNRTLLEIGWRIKKFDISIVSILDFHKDYRCLEYLSSPRTKNGSNSSEPTIHKKPHGFKIRYYPMISLKYRF